MKNRDITEKRKSLGISVKEFADALGYDQSGERRLRNWEKGLEDVPEDEYEKIFGKFKENYIFYGGKPEADKKCYQMIVDVDEDSYIVSFYYDKVIAGWNHFLNKANMG